jgi:hypothetical protein
LVIPRDFLSFSTASNDAHVSTLLLDQTLDLADAENTVLLRARACFAWTGEVAAVVSAIMISNCVATAVIDDAHVDLLGVDVAGPEDFQGIVDFLEIGVRLDLGAQSGNGGVPGTVKVVGQDGEPVDLSLETLDVHILRILVLSGNDDAETEVVAEGLTHLLEEFDLVGAVPGAAAAAFVARPLPIDVDTAELPISDELL